MNRNFWIGCVVLISLTACPSDSENLSAPSSALDKASLIVEATVVKSEAEFENGIAAWKVDLRTAQGAEVEIYCRQDNLDLLRIDGESGPFDYNATPGNGLIDFDEAKSLGAQETSETLMEWRLRPEDKFNNQWVYSLEYTEAEVYINATDGSVLEVSS